MTVYVCSSAHFLYKHQYLQIKQNQYIRARSTVEEDLNPLLLDKGAFSYILSSSLFTIIIWYHVRATVFL
jgi:hypothetical protein